MLFTLFSEWSSTRAALASSKPAASTADEHHGLPANRERDERRGQCTDACEPALRNAAFFTGSLRVTRT
jgi:hypothetical protein